MKVGVPKEIKTHEYRVGLTPGAVREYVAAGHSVVVENNAGAGIGATGEMIARRCCFNLISSRPRTAQRPDRYSASAARSSGAVASIKSDMPGLLPRARERKSSIVFDRYCLLMPAKRGTVPSP
jgi:hypothetical protein